MFDAGLFQRVLSNLLLNAVKRSPRNETIQVRCLTEERLLRFEVSYKGSATAADSTTQTREHGPAPTRDLSGSAHTSRLRLAFCKRAVEAHGGNMGVVSKTGTGGGAFWVEIPMVAVPASLQPA